MLSVKSNLLAANANRHLNANTKKNQKIAEKLSSGYQINRAADDAAGLAISEKMRRQIRGLNQSAENIEDGIGYVKTAEGALNEVHDMLQRINELSVKAANGTLAEQDREHIDSEVQALKKEVGRVFDTTTFNERKIWKTTGEVQVGTTPTRAVGISNTSTSITVTNDNYDVLPGGTLSYGSSGKFDVKADDSGIVLSWVGFNGTYYETKTIEWDYLEGNNFVFEMSRFFDADRFPELYDSNGEPVFKHQLGFAPNEYATRQDIIDSLNNSRVSSTAYSYFYGSWEDAAGGAAGNMLSVSGNLYYPGAYASQSKGGYDFDLSSDDDTFFEPVLDGNTNLTACPEYSTMENARDDDKGWTFSFYMEGIGNVTASSYSTTYYSNSRAPEDEGLWWYRWHDSNGREHTSSYTYSSAGTLSGVMDALTDGGRGTTPGLLNEDSGGSNNNASGYINIHFALKAGNEYQYSDYNGVTQKEDSIGNFTLGFSVSRTWDETDVWERVKNALKFKGDTILDFRTSRSSASLGSMNPATKYIDAPVYGGICNFYVQAGTEAGQHIDIEYESLNLWALGLNDTNVLTADDAGNAIDEVKEALETISEQRVIFGAYQNRLEHAYNINKNVEENTQASESVIRDADVADLMMEYAVNNILAQAGTSMLTQANQSKQIALDLLGE